MLKPVTPDHLSQLEGLLPQGSLREAEPRYLSEPRGKWRGQAAAVALPRSAEDAAKIVRFAAEHRIGLVPYGGGTGLVCGQVMPDGPAPLIVSLERMNAIRSIHPEENALIAEAGASLQSLHDAASAHGRLFPLSIASKGTAQIGGNLATNAGGINVLRYGNARDLCLGLEAVLPDGQIWHGLTRLRKDNTGYDLRNLLIGSEGTLGLITAAALKLFAKPAQTGTALFATPSPGAALKALARLRDVAGEAVSAFELIHRQGLDFLDDVGAEYRKPFADTPEWMILTELGLSQGPTPEALFESFFETALDEGLVFDGLIAQSEAQAEALWAMRELIPEANKRIKAISSHDVSLPLGAVAEFITSATQALAQHGNYRINCFGHLGDGNLHFNVFPAKGHDRDAYKNISGEVQQLIHEMAVQMGGSFSAEHGVGRLKVEELRAFGDPARLAAMKAIKASLDPIGIMNPGVILG